MLAIYVTKKWVQSVGSAADLMLLEVGDTGDCDILMASDKNVVASFPFVQLEAVRHPATLDERKDVFISVKIPTSEVAAIFDLTEADSKKIGFAPSPAPAAPQGRLT